MLLLPHPTGREHVPSLSPQSAQSLDLTVWRSVFPCNNANTVVCISGTSCNRALGHRGRRIKTFHPIRSCEVPRADH